MPVTTNPVRNRARVVLRRILEGVVVREQHFLASHVRAVVNAPVRPRCPRTRQSARTRRREGARVHEDEAARLPTGSTRRSDHQPRDHRASLERLGIGAGQVRTPARRERPRRSGSAARRLRRVGIEAAHRDRAALDALEKKLARRIRRARSRITITIEPRDRTEDGQSDVARRQTVPLRVLAPRARVNCFSVKVSQL